jgi:hypothetical protein
MKHFLLAVAGGGRMAESPPSPESAERTVIAKSDYLTDLNTGVFISLSGSTKANCQNGTARIGDTEEALVSAALRIATAQVRFYG